MRLSCRPGNSTDARQKRRVCAREEGGMQILHGINMACVNSLVYVIYLIRHNDISEY